MLRIAKIVGHELSVPLKPMSHRSSIYGAPDWENKVHTILEVHTDEGYVGLGGGQGSGEGQARQELEALQGVDLEQMSLAAPQGSAFRDNPFTKYDDPWGSVRPWERACALPEQIESALYDVLGKRYGVPAYVLMGGAYHEKVAVDFWMDRQTPEDAGKHCAEAKAMGFTTVKMKCALGDPLVEIVEAVRDACGPTFKVTLDPNGRFYRPAEALKVAHDLARLDHPIVFEDPFPRMTNLDWHVLFRQKSPIPLAIHLHTAEQMIDVVKREACDYVNMAGGIKSVVELGHIASAAGMPSWHGSNLDLAVRAASEVHVSAAVRMMVLPGDSPGPFIRAHPIVKEYYPLENGHVTIPKRPGYGLDLDYDAIDKYAVRQWTIEA
jgi:muconate cycloisomerase